MKSYKGMEEIYMSVQKKITKKDYIIGMDDVVREGNETLRTVSDEVPLPLCNEDIVLGEKMLEFLRNSQTPNIAEKMHLRPGVGIAANQLDIPKKIIAVLIPEESEFNEEEEVNGLATYKLSEIMYNAKIVSHSVQNSASEFGEGCLSVDEMIPGLVIRHARVTVEYYDKNSQKHKIRLNDFPSICVQHEIDHTNGIMFYDHINKKEPWKREPGLVVVQ